MKNRTFFNTFFLVFVSIILSCSNIKTKEPRINFNWKSSKTSKYNFTTSTFSPLNINLEVENQTDSFLFFSNSHGNFIAKNIKSKKLKFSHSLFNSVLVYPKTRVKFLVQLAYAKMEEPNENDLEFELYYISNDTSYNKKTIFEYLTNEDEKNIDISRLIIKDSIRFYRTKDYSFELVDNNSEVNH